MKKIAVFGYTLSIATLAVMSHASKAYAQLSLCPTLNNNSASLCTANLQIALPGVINILLFLSFIAALLFLIYGGIRWILSGGDKEGTAKAKGTVTAALIGLAIVLASWLLVNIVLGLFGLNNGGTGLTVPTLFGSQGVQTQ